MTTTTTNGNRSDLSDEADGATVAAARKALAERGLTRIDELVTMAAPAAILGWCRWWDDQRGVNPGLLADRIRSGQEPPKSPAARRSILEAQREYGEAIREWLLEKMPDVCKQDRRVVEWERRVRGDAEADALAAVTEPHYAAVAAVIRLHYEVKGKITVGEHGSIIRAAVKAANEQAIADSREILDIRSARSSNPEVPS